MTSQVFWGGSDRHLRLVDLHADLVPVAHGVQIHTALDERRGKVLAARFEGVSSYRRWTLFLVGFKELMELGDE
jgi:hypothetical protein